MATNPLNVLRVNTVEETAAYRNAVTQIILNIQREFEETHIDIAERIDVSVGTISNAANKKTDLNPLYLARLGKVYGSQVLNPYVALFGGRVEPIEGGESDPLPSLTRASYELAAIRAPESQGGTAETPQELSRVLPHLEAVRDDVTAKIVSIKRRLAA